MGKNAKIVLSVLVVLFIAAQFRQPARTNPATDPAASFTALAKPSPGAVAVIDRACKDCHSNQTSWPWYSHVAPASWLVAKDVEDGRRHMNLSEWGKLSPELRLQRLGDMCRLANSGEMPPLQYRFIHKEARLTKADIISVCMLSVNANKQ